MPYIAFSYRDTTCSANKIKGRLALSVFKIFLILIVVFCLGPQTTKAQNQHTDVSYLRVNDGLSQSNVKSILKDNQGYLWFATDDGLNRYNSHSFKIYRHIPGDSHSLQVNIIETLFKDIKGNIYVGTGGGGLSIYNAKEDCFTNYTGDKNRPGMLSNNDVTDIFEDKSHNIWVGTYSGLNLFK